MDDNLLKRLILSIGMSCFVKYHRDFADLTLPDSSLIERIRAAEGYTELACMTRVRKSREIIRAGRAHDALKRIALSGRVPAQVANAASQLLKQST